jgi:hypothetical protein
MENQRKLREIHPDSKDKKIKQNRIKFIIMKT